MTENKSKPFGTVWFIFVVLSALLFVPEFIHGEFIVRNKGIYLTGTEARCAAAFVIFAFFAIGPYLYIRNAFKETKAGGYLLCLGIVVGYTVTAIASLKIPAPPAITIGAISTLLSLMPGFVVCRKATKVPKQKDQNNVNHPALPTLQEALGSRKYEIVKKLLSEGAEADMTLKGERTLLHEAASNNWSGIVKILVMRGVDPVAEDNKGNTAMDIAFRSYHRTVAKRIAVALLEKHAFLKNKDDLLKEAAERRWTDVAEILEQLTPA
jgi:hypothetical protein